MADITRIDISSKSALEIREIISSSPETKFDFVLNGEDSQRVAIQIEAAAGWEEELGRRIEKANWQKKILEDPEAFELYKFFCETFKDFCVEFSEDGTELLVFGKSKILLVSYLAESVLSPRFFVPTFKLHF